MTLQYVPIIDLAPYFAGTPEGKLQVARAVTRPVATSAFWSSPTIRFLPN